MVHGGLLISRHVATQAACRRHIASGCVVHDHSVSAESPGKRANRVHHALDPVGGNHLMRSYKSLRSGGRLYCFGASSDVKGSKRSLISAIKMWKSTPKFDPLRMMNSNKAVFGVHLGTWKDQEILAQHMIELEKLLREGGINPIVDKVFRFEDVSKAQKYIHDRKNKGKVLLDFSPL